LGKGKGGRGMGIGGWGRGGGASCLPEKILFLRNFLL